MIIKKLGAIDVGSNGVRLLINTIYEKPNGDARFNKTSLTRMPIRLGKDVFDMGQISEDNQQRLIKAMKCYQLIMDVFEVDHYLAYATSAMREASNGEEIANQIKQQSGINLQLIDGEKEANVIFKTELKSYLQEGKNYLYVDVGGGSTELTLLINGKITNSQSFKVGTVRMLNNRVEQGVFPEQMKSWLKQNVKNTNCEIIGSGGNINFIFKRSANAIGQPITAQYINQQYQLLKNTSYEERLHDYDMKPDRADVILPALEIYTKVAKWSNCQQVNVPKIGLADGMIRYLYDSLR